MRAKKQKICLIYFFVLFLSICITAQAEDSQTILVNSEDWQDVYSAVVYANLLDKPFNFITTLEHSRRLSSTISSENIYLIESDKKPIVKGYKSTLEAKGFHVDERIIQSNINFNLELAKELDTNKFIIIDKSYGYNAISVVPYSKVSGSYVLFADTGNIADILDFLEGKDPRILVYGHVEQEVLDALSAFDPETIDTGDKFDDNIEVVRKYRQINPINQVTITDGDFMESGLMKGSEAILLIGTDTVASQTVEYVKESGISVAVLTGNSLVSSAQKLKAQTGISIFMKFGQGTDSSSSSSEIRSLDFYYLPEYPLDVAVTEISYNPSTGNLEVTYKNNADSFAYVKSSSKVYVGSELVQTIGEREAFLLEGGEEKGIEYSLDMGSKSLQEGIKTEVYLEFGASKKSLEKVITAEHNITIVENEVNVRINEVTAAYNKEDGRLTLKIENTGSSGYMKPTLRLKENGLLQEFEKDTTSLSANSISRIIFEVDLSEDDLEDNKKVEVIIQYGGRKNFLNKEVVKAPELNVLGKTSSAGIPYTALIVGLLLVVIVLLVIVIRKK